MVTKVKEEVGEKAKQNTGLIPLQVTHSSRCVSINLETATRKSAWWKHIRLEKM